MRKGMYFPEVRDFFLQVEQDCLPDLVKPTILLALGTMP